MIIQLEDEVKAYLIKNKITKLLIDMMPDMTNSGCGCGKSKKFYTPYIRPLKTSEHVKKYNHFQIDQIDLFLSEKAMEATEEKITVKLEKSLFVKNLAVEGIGFIVE